MAFGCFPSNLLCLIGFSLWLKPHRQVYSFTSTESTTTEPTSTTTEITSTSTESTTTEPSSTTTEITSTSTESTTTEPSSTTTEITSTSTESTTTEPTSTTTEITSTSTESTTTEPSSTTTEITSTSTESTTTEPSSTTTEITSTSTESTTTEPSSTTTEITSTSTESTTTEPTSTTTEITSTSTESTTTEPSSTTTEITSTSTESTTTEPSSTTTEITSTSTESTTTEPSSTTTEITSTSTESTTTEPSSTTTEITSTSTESTTTEPTSTTTEITSTSTESTTTEPSSTTTEITSTSTESTTTEPTSTTTEITSTSTESTTTEPTSTTTEITSTSTESTTTEPSSTTTEITSTSTESTTTEPTSTTTEITSTSTESTTTEPSSTTTEITSTSTESTTTEPSSTTTEITSTSTESTTTEPSSTTTEITSTSTESTTTEPTSTTTEITSTSTESTTTEPSSTTTEITSTSSQSTTTEPSSTTTEITSTSSQSTTSELQSSTTALTTTIPRSNCCPTGGFWSEWVADAPCATSCGSCSQQIYRRKCLTEADCGSCRYDFILKLNNIFYLVVRTSKFKIAMLVCVISLLIRVVPVIMQQFPELCTFVDPRFFFHVLYFALAINGYCSQTSLPKQGMMKHAVPKKESGTTGANGLFAVEQRVVTVMVLAHARGHVLLPHSARVSGMRPSRSFEGADAVSDAVPCSTTSPACCVLGGVWSEWSSGDSCNDTCGNCGTTTLSRICLSDDYGCSCSGNSTKVAECAPTPCPFPRTTCCGSRTKIIVGNEILCSASDDSDPPPSTLCSTDCCPSTGGYWSEWTTGGACPTSCGSCSTVTQKRVCMSPSSCPCRGTDSREVNCNIGVCFFPLDSCCNGLTAMVINNKHACGPQPNYTTPYVPYDPNCTETCCAETGIWSEWTFTSIQCLDYCGSCGNQTRTRTCLSEVNGCPCQGVTSITEPCGTGVCFFPRLSCCPGWTATVQNNAHVCGPLTTFLNDPAKLNTCGVSCCPSAGIWGEWTTVSACNDTCGSCGFTTRSRKCLSLQYGCDCSGSTVETRSCNKVACYTGSACCAGKYLATGYDGAQYCQDNPPETCTGSWTDWMTVSGATCNDTCGNCGLIDQYRYCFPSGCQCSGSFTSQAACANSVCLFPRTSCCSPYKKLIDLANKVFYCG
uniref:Uncharacterized protein n=1 Tax=Caenorhabditis japonica TaxID=281687 RepID=A0A8R1E6Q8_CAEJA